MSNDNNKSTKVVQLSDFVGKIEVPQLNDLLLKIELHNALYDKYRFGVNNRPHRVFEFMTSNPDNWLDVAKFDPYLPELVWMVSNLGTAALAYAAYLRTLDQSSYLTLFQRHGDAILKLREYAESFVEGYNKLATAVNDVPGSEMVQSELVYDIVHDINLKKNNARPRGVPSDYKYKAVYDFFLNGFHPCNWKQAYTASFKLRT